MVSIRILCQYVESRKQTAQFLITFQKGSLIGNREEGDRAVCKIARCHDWWRHYLPLVMDTIHILYQYFESRMQTVYHSTAPE